MSDSGSDPAQTRHTSIRQDAPAKPAILTQAFLPLRRVWPDSSTGSTNLVSPPTKGRTYPAIDALRGFAAVTVVIYHVIAHFEWKSFPSIPYVTTWLKRGWMAVDMFFVISGFVIALSALNLLERNRSQYMREFCQRRLARIVPLHYLTCLAFTLFIAPALMFEPDFLFNALSHLSFTHNWHYKTMGAIDGPNWSLGVEMQFYLLILLTAPLFCRMNPVITLAVCIGTTWIWRGGVFALTQGQVWSGVNMTWFGISQVPGALDEFGFGIMLATILHGDSDGKIHALLHKTRFLWPLAATGVFALAMHFLSATPEFWQDWKMVVFWKTFLATGFFLVLVSACAIQDRWILWLLTPLRYLGTISFGIYLWHSLVLMSLRPLLLGDPARGCNWVLGLSIFLGALSWHLFEKPMMDRLNSRKKKSSNRTQGNASEPLVPPSSSRVPA